MKYTAVNELNHFEYHDAELKKIDFNQDNMIWRLSSLNATTQNSQNSFSEDMCIKEAVIVFEHFKIEKIVFSAYKSYDSNQNLIESVEAITANSSEYDEILKNTMDTYCYLFSMVELPKLNDTRNLVCFTMNGAEIYDLTLSFSKSVVQWDEYDGKAWYEDEKWKKK